MLSDFIFKSYRHFKVALNNFSKKLTFFSPFKPMYFSYSAIALKSNVKIQRHGVNLDNSPITPWRYSTRPLNIAMALFLESQE